MAKTLFIGMDGATFTVLDHLTTDQTGEGVAMPFMKKFMEKGTRAKLRSTANPLTPPAWVSLTTGRHPGTHGIYDFVRLDDRGSYVYYDLFGAKNIKAETIWSIMNRQNRSTVALNFTMTAPPREGTGSIVPGFVSWKHLRRNTTPPALFDRICTIPDFEPKELAWDFDREKEAVAVLSEAEMEHWVRYHGVREKQWYRVAEYLLKEDDPDMLGVVFDGVDKIQHQAWQFLDPELIPKDPSPWEKRMRQACVEFFTELDQYIEKLVTLAGPDCQVFMGSDHGFTWSSEVLRINMFLAEKGYLFWGDEETQKTGADSMWSANLDWDRTVAYCGTPSSNAIRIRVADAPGKPGVKPSEYTSLRDQLIRDLESLEDENGKRLISEVLKREDVFNGQDMANAPDLTLVLHDFGFVSVANLEPMHLKRDPVGTHHPNGVFLACGPGIAAKGEIERLDIVDVAATLLYSQGLSIPSDFEGEVPLAVFEPDYKSKHPVEIGEPTLPVAKGVARVGQASAEPDEDSEEYRKQILDQLQMLGYME
ncbi:alkaline phosphatase family protein [Haliea sp. E1-2-M8]|uniref:alkaline phosphatase family protein n=1 Tax=Haliea sp. E1-2-M8 TaxID=3064706 RepID=UPI002717740E|nr:alkaline phosphatase family protein [Haliea sp. E1-2-M8]MDO8861553.1 alkaline phosphatase family protein [Haliea sp. E1-2-M8]